MDYHFLSSLYYENLPRGEDVALADESRSEHSSFNSCRNFFRQLFFDIRDRKSSSSSSSSIESFGELVVFFSLLSGMSFSNAMSRSDKVSLNSVFSRFKRLKLSVVSEGLVDDLIELLVSPLESCESLRVVLSRELQLLLLPLSSSSFLLFSDLD